MKTREISPLNDIEQLKDQIQALSEIQQLAIVKARDEAVVSKFMKRVTGQKELT